MPKRKRLRVEAWSALLLGRMYLVYVRNIEVSRKTEVVRVTLEHLDREQEGRVHEVELPLPVRPAGRTSSFFQACGVEVALNAEFFPEDAVGKIVAVEFGPLHGYDQWQPVRFGPPDQETKNERESW